MNSLSFLSLFKGDDLCCSVDLFNISSSSSTTDTDSDTSTTTTNGTSINNSADYTANGKNTSDSFEATEHQSLNNSQAHSQDGHSQSRKLKKTPVSVIIDSESCLDRIYGGYYSDWASGGQWNRMLGYIANLTKACQINKVHITVAMRGGVEKEHAAELFRCNREFKDRLNRVIMHLQNRGTPPPKVWWLPPTCLREAICLAMQFFGIPVLCTSGDYYLDVIEHIESHGMHGILSDDSMFALLRPPKLFAAHDFKLTYKGSLETKEYMLQKWADQEQINTDRLPLLASLIGNHILPLHCLKEFHQDITDDVADDKSSEEMEMKFLQGIVNFVRKFPDPNNLDAIGNVVFRNSSCSLDDGIAKLKKSVCYFKRATSLKSQPKQSVKTAVKINPVPNESQCLKTPAEMEGHYVIKEDKKPSSPAIESNGCESEHDHADVEVEDQVKSLNLNGDINANSSSLPAAICLEISPSDAILKLATARHKKGFMSPIIIQSLYDREVRLPCYLENMQPNDDLQSSTVELYRPIRQSIYAILHNLNKHLYDSKKTVEESGHTVLADDITIEITEHYLGSLGAEVSHPVKVSPLAWPVPSIESLWLGVKPENKQRRMKAFLSCMQAGSDPLITNVSHVPERFLILCCVLRYLLKCEPAAITIAEVDATLSMATSQILFDVQTMQDMQLPLITPRGAHVASMLMAGVQHAMLVNDVCGAPIRREMTSPWLYFDGKLFQYKLLKASSSHHVQRLDLCDGQMAQVIQMERLRQVVLHGLEEKFGEQLHTSSIASALPGGRMFTTPTAYLRPTFTSASRGKGSLLGEFVPVNSQLDARGGKLQVAGQVVATWGPRPGTNHGGRDYYRAPQGSYNTQVHEQGPPTKPNSVKFNGKKQGYSHGKANRQDAKNKNQNSNQSSSAPVNQDTESKPVIIATKPDKGDQLDVKVLPDDDDDTLNTNSVIETQDCNNDSSITADTSATVLSS